MNESATLTILGSGSSLGVPLINCACSVCTSADHRNKRQRTAFLIEQGDKAFLVDFGPDLRRQLLDLKRNVPLCGLCLTHCHFDHMGGILDLRSVAGEKTQPLVLLLSEHTKNTFIKRSWGIHACMQFGILNMVLQSFSMESHSIEEFCGFPKIDCCFYQHSQDTVTGYRFGSLAIITDIGEWNDEITQLLSCVEIAIIGVGRWKCHKKSSHTSIEEIVKYTDSLPNLRKVYFTHLSHYIDANKIEYPLPLKYQLAWDGLSVEFSWSNNLKNELSL